MCEENEERPAKRVRLDGKWSAEVRTWKGRVAPMTTIHNALLLQEDEELVTKAFELTHQLCGKGRLITDYSALGKVRMPPSMS